MILLFFFVFSLIAKNRFHIIGRSEMKNSPQIHIYVCICIVDSIIITVALCCSKIYTDTKPNFLLVLRA